MMIETKSTAAGRAPAQLRKDQPWDRLAGQVGTTKAPRTTLSVLWLFATLNFIYCDVIGVMDRAKQFVAGNVAGIHITQGFLLASAVLVEIPMLMVLLSWILPYRANRLANIIAGAIMTAVQLATLFVGMPTAYYLFFSVIEIASTSVVVWYAWRWADPKVIA